MDKIKTYTTEAFHSNFIQQQKLSEILKSGNEKFFIAREEVLIHKMKFPIRSIRMASHALMYITSGSAEMIIGSSTYKIYEDECWIVPAGQIFSIGNVDVNSATGFLCGFSNDIGFGNRIKLNLPKEFEFLNIWGNHHFVLGKQISEFIKPLFERLFFEYAENGLANIDIIQSYFIAILSELSSVQSSLPQTGKQQYISLTNKFKELLFSNIKQNHFVSDYASLLNISPNHLNKVIKETTGKSPSKWIEEALIAEAKVLLYQTDISVNEVAFEVGVLDQSYFSRLFRKHEGISPLKYREMIE